MSRPCGSNCKKSACNGDPSLIPGLGRAPGEGNSNPLQYSCLGDPMDREARSPWDHRESELSNLTNNTTDWVDGLKGRDFFLTIPEAGSLRPGLGSDASLHPGNGCLLARSSYSRESMLARTSVRNGWRETALRGLFL